MKILNKNFKKIEKGELGLFVFFLAIDPIQNIFYYA